MHKDVKLFLRIQKNGLQLLILRYIVCQNQSTNLSNYIYICINTYVYIYIHTYIHIYIYIQRYITNMDVCILGSVYGSVANSASWPGGNSGGSGGLEERLQNMEELLARPRGPAEFSAPRC